MSKRSNITDVEFEYYFDRNEERHYRINQQVSNTNTRVIIVIITILVPSNTNTRVIIVIITILVSSNTNTRVIIVIITI